MTEIQRVFLQLVRLGIGFSDEPNMVLQTAWGSLMVIANHQGLTAIVLDSLERLPVESRPPKEFLLNWIGITMQQEQNYAIQWKTACELAILLKKGDIRTYVLKGFVVAECYPKPSHRCSADLDCYLRTTNSNAEVWEVGNALVEQSGIKVNRNYYKNSTWYLPGLTVENHRWFTPFRGNKRLTKLEQLLQGLISEDDGNDQIEGTWLNRPPVMLSALFLIEHAYSHFLHEGLTWRHVLDWVMFSRKYKDEIDWDQLGSWINEFGFRRFYDSYEKLGLFLIGEGGDLTEADKMMMVDIWSPLDLHETVDGFRGKIALAGNTWRARWKYREFTDITWLQALWIQVNGFLFIREPRSVI